MIRYPEFILYMYTSLMREGKVVEAQAGLIAYLEKELAKYVCDQTNQNGNVRV